MLKKILVFSVTLAASLYAMMSFAIAPGAAQAQIQNNREVMQQNKQFIKQQKRLQQQRQLQRQQQIQQQPLR